MYGWRPECVAAKETWPSGWKSCVATTVVNAGTSRAMGATTSSPPATPSGPPGG